MFTVQANLPGAQSIIDKCGLGPGGKTQEFFTSELMRLSDNYVPMDGAAVLKASARMDEGKDAIIYATPYARYHWYGKLMVDPITGKGAFHDPVTGRFWSRPKVQKVLTDRDMKYQGAPMRGPKWVERCWADNQTSITQATEQYVNGGTK